MIALLAAQKAEIYHTLQSLRHGQRLQWGGGRLTAGELEGRPVIAGWTGVGTTFAAMTAQYICDAWQPSAILCSGLGGGVNPDFKSGQVVAARDLVQWDMDASGVGIKAGVFPGEKDQNGKALEVIPADPELLAKLSEEAGEELPIGRFASGNRFVHASYEALERSGADVVDMESIGIALAGYMNSVPVGIVRIIADTRDGNKPRNFRKFLDESSKKLADLNRRMLQVLA